jgi:hypothetical protein
MLQIIYLQRQINNCFFTFAAAARVVELVDTQDLKSCGHCGCTGSIPVPGTKKGFSPARKPFFIYSYYLTPKDCLISRKLL